LTQFPLNIYQLHAEYNPASDEYCAHRVVQAFETSQFIRYTRNKADFCILGGDLNTEPENLAYRLICDHTSLKDLYLSTGKVFHFSIFMFFKIDPKDLT
jgi:sphingomyelin phosphodiesterase 2